MHNIFNPIVGCSTDIRVKAEGRYQFETDRIFTLLDISNDISIYVNKNKVNSTTFLLKNDDKVDLYFRSPAGFGETRLITYKIDESYGVATCTTKALNNGESVIKESFKPLSYYDDLGFVKSNDGAKVITLNFDTNTKGIINFSDSVVPNSLASNFAFVHVYQGSKILKVDLTNNKVLKVIPITGSISGLEYNVASKRIWYSDNINNVVKVIDETGKVYNTFNVTKPIDISTNIDGNMFSVCSYDKFLPKVTITTASFNGVSSDWASSIVSEFLLPAKPYASLIDIDQNTYVTTVGNKLVKIDVLENEYTLELTDGLRGIKSDGVFLYVAASNSQKVHKISIANFELIESYDVPGYPTDIAICSDGIYAISDGNELYKISGNTATLFDSYDRTLFYTDADKFGNLYLVSMFPNQPAFTGTEDKYSENLKLESPEFIYKKIYYQSPEYNVTDIDTSTKVSVPEFVTLSVNGVVQVDKNAFIQPNDKIQFSFFNDAKDNEYITFPIAIGPRVLNFHSVSKEVKIEVAFLPDFNNRYNEDFNKEIDSGESILKITPSNIELPLTFTSSGTGKLYLNGVEYAGDLVKTGDKLKIVDSTGPYYGHTKINSVKIHYTAKNWSIATKCTQYEITSDKDKVFYEPYSFKSLNTSRTQKFTKYNKNHSVNKTIDLNSSTPIVAPKSDKFAYLAAFYQNAIYGIDTESMTLSFRLYLDKPYATTPVIDTEPNNGIAVSMSSKNVVKVLNYNFSDSYDIPVGKSPMGIASYGEFIIVACHENECVDVLKYSSFSKKYELYKRIDFPGSKPFEVVHDTNSGLTYVTDITNPNNPNFDRVIVLNEEGFVNEILVGQDPFSLSIDNGKLAVANAYSNDISIVDLINNTTKTIKVRYVPTSLMLTDNDLTVCTYNSVYEYDLTTFEEKRIFQEDYYIYIPIYDKDGDYIRTDVIRKDNIYVYSGLTKTTDDQLRFFSQLIDVTTIDNIISSKQPKFEPPLKSDYDLDVLTESTTTSIITDVSRPQLLNFPVDDKLQVFVNEIQIFEPQLINNLDKVTIKYTTENLYDHLYSAQIYIGCYHQLVEFKTKVKNFPDYLVYDSTYDVINNELELSNELVVKGLQSACELTINDYRAYFILNGENVGKKAIVVEGDKLSIGYDPNIRHFIAKDILVLADDTVCGRWTLFPAILTDLPEVPVLRKVLADEEVLFSEYVRNYNNECADFIPLLNYKLDSENSISFESKISPTKVKSTIYDIKRPYTSEVAKHTGSSSIVGNTPSSYKANVNYGALQRYNLYKNNVNYGYVQSYEHNHSGTEITYEEVRKPVDYKNNVNFLNNNGYVCKHDIRNIVYDRLPDPSSNKSSLYFGDIQSYEHTHVGNEIEYLVDPKYKTVYSDMHYVECDYEVLAVNNVKSKVRDHVLKEAEYIKSQNLDSQLNSSNRIQVNNSEFLLKPISDYSFDTRNYRINPVNIGISKDLDYKIYSIEYLGYGREYKNDDVRYLTKSVEYFKNLFSNLYLKDVEYLVFNNEFLSDTREYKLNEHENIDPLDRLYFKTVTESYTLPNEYYKHVSQTYNLPQFYETHKSENYTVPNEYYKHVSQTYNLPQFYETHKSENYTVPISYKTHKSENYTLPIEFEIYKRNPIEIDYGLPYTIKSIPHTQNISYSISKLDHRSVQVDYKVNKNDADLTAIRLLPETNKYEIITQKMRDSSNYDYDNLSIPQIVNVCSDNIYIDNKEYSAEEKGSYTSNSILPIIQNNVTYSKFKLSDKTYMYTYDSEEEYGPCVIDMYVVDYGYVKGG